MVKAKYTNPGDAILFCGEKVRQYSDVGGYPLFYVTANSEALCADCVQAELPQCQDPNEPSWFVVAHAVNWEDPDLCCDHCGDRIESAYAEEDVT